MSVLSGKVAVITGGSAGIGRATALELARLGASVVIQARRAAKLDATAADIRQLGGQVATVVGDAAKEPDVDALLARAQEFSRSVGAGGRVDIAIASAGRGLAGGLISSDPGQWRAMFEVNVLGAAYLMRRAAALMAAQGSGDIIVLGSASGHNVSPFSGFYGSSKFAVAGMAEGLRREVCAKGVRVTTLKPAIVLSEFQDVAGYTEENFYRNVMRFGKLLAPEDVARTIGFVVTQPPHVHLNEIVMRPTGQDYP